LREALSEQRRAEHAASLAAHVAQAREEEQRHAAASLKQHVVTEVQERLGNLPTVTTVDIPQCLPNNLWPLLRCCLATLPIALNQALRRLLQSLWQHHHQIFYELCIPKLMQL